MQNLDTLKIYYRLIESGANEKISRALSYSLNDAYKEIIKSKELSSDQLDKMRNLLEDILTEDI